MEDNETGEVASSPPEQQQEEEQPQPPVKEEETEATPAAEAAPAVREETKPAVIKAKPTAAKRKGRKTVKKKPDDMPRRPLSAYNFFFSEMRSKLLADRAAGKESEFQKFLDERQEIEGEKKNGFFSNMGKYVAKRWKELQETPEELLPFTEKAEKDLQRYRKEMDEYREGVARKTRLASEQKLREQEAEAAKVPQMGPNNPGQAMGQPWMMQNPMMGFQNPADPSFQLLLRQQLLQAQNPQLNALFLQQQFGGGFPGAMGQFQPPQQQQPGGPGGMSQQPGGDMSGAPSNGQQVGGQQFDMSQQAQQQGGPNQQDMLNNLQQQQQNRMMYPMMQGQFGMPGGGPMGMMGGGGMPGPDTAGGMDAAMPSPMQMAQQPGPPQPTAPQQQQQQGPLQGQTGGGPPNAAGVGGSWQ